MSVTFRPAVRERTSLFVGLAGPSGAGKTLSAIRLARGIVHGDDSRIFVIDTEAGRATHYACAPGEPPTPYGQWRPGQPYRASFQYAELRAPFSPDRYQEAIQAALDLKAGVIVTDSASHEHESEGGILDWHERELKRLAGDDPVKRERMTFAAWIAPKAAHARYVTFLLQQRCHFIFCFRAKEKMRLVHNPRTGKTEPIQLGWTAICPDRFEYEMTMLLMLPPNAKGVPDLSLEATKLNAAHAGYITPGEPLNERCGELLAEWAAGGTTGTDSDRAALIRDIKALLDQLRPTDATVAEWKATYLGAQDADPRKADVAALSDFRRFLQTVTVRG